jgi:hypothetical protein
MPSQPHPGHHRPASKPRRPVHRPWPALPIPTQRQLAQEVARLLQRILDAEAGHADHAK